MERGQPQKLLPNSSNTDDEEKRIIRKEIERQRRLQMSSLLASLRSQIPLQLIKGKRSMFDLINESVNHINHLKNNIQELSAKRDKLKRSLNSSDLGKEIGGSSVNKIFNCVTVRHFIGGVEIVTTINGPGQEGFLLSRVLEVVLEEGLDVINCVFTKKEEAFYVTTIQCQARDLACIDLVGLQQKLNDVISST